jgi:NitT/TauT family transport system substrate-binding protein
MPPKTRKKPLMIVLDNDATGAQTEKHQVRMVGEINKLTDGSDGSLVDGGLSSAPSTR